MLPLNAVSLREWIVKDVVSLEDLTATGMIVGSDFTSHWIGQLFRTCKLSHSTSVHRRFYFLLTQKQGDF